MITRSEVLTRAKTIWTPNTVPYSQDTIHQPDGYRQDCSGYLSLCWGIPPGENGGWGGQNTVTLVTRGYMKEIPASDLKPGDAVGNCGPGTAGDAGHIVLFEKWANDDPNNDDFWLWEQAPGTGPRRRMVTYPYPGMSAPPWKAYRFVGITDNPFVPGGDMKPAGLVGPIQLPQGDGAHQNYSIPPVNAGAVEWGRAWLTIFTDLFGGRAKFRIAVTPGNDTWSFLGNDKPPVGTEPTLTVESGKTFNVELPAGTRGISVIRLLADADDTAAGSVSMSIEYGQRG